MRLKLLRGDDEATVLLVHPARRSKNTPGRSTRSAARGAALQTAAAW